MRFAPALVLTAFIVGTAPFLGKLQKLAGDHLDRGSIVLFLTGFFVLSGTFILAAVLWRARHVPAPAKSDAAQASPTRPWLWVGLGGSLVVLRIVLSDRGSASAAAYERLHFILYGLLAILLYRALAQTSSRAWSALGSAAGVLTVSLLDEGVQWLVPLRTGEFFDLGLNLYGGFAGLLVAQALPARSRRESLDERPVVVLIALALLGAVAFIDRAHLGHRIEDPELGAFHSFFTPSELEAANEERRERWAGNMPKLPLREALAIEDYFLTEAGWHVLRRNRARSAGDQDVVWHETRILERYYPVTLEIPDGNGWYRYRLPEIERAAFDDAPPIEDYWSPADNGRIWLWPRWTLLVALVAIAGLASALWRAAQSQPSRVSSMS